jgi:hypothetical protein
MSLAEVSDPLQSVSLSFSVPGTERLVNNRIVTMPHI